MFESLNFGAGKIVYNDFDLKPDISMEEQIFSLKEDLFQVNYNDQYIIDIGWHPEFTVNGKFKIQIIKDYDWTSPIYFKKCKRVDTLNKYMKECIDYVSKLLKDKD